MKEYPIIGVGGTNASGKDNLGIMLQERYGYLFVSNSDILREEAKKRGLSTDRENLRNISAEWRREHGMGVMVDKAVEVYEKVKEQYNGLATASYRHPAEADRTHELGGKVVWTDSDPKVRYDRLHARGRADDGRTFEQFLADEAAEMKISGDAATLQMADVKPRADYVIMNNGNDIEAFKDEAAKILGLL